MSDLWRREDTWGPRVGKSGRESCGGAVELAQELEVESKRWRVGREAPPLLLVRSGSGEGVEGAGGDKRQAWRRERESDNGMGCKSDGGASLLLPHHLFHTHALSLTPQ